MARRLLHERTLVSTLQTALLATIMVAFTMLVAWRVLGVWSIPFAVVAGLLALRSADRISLPGRLRNARLLSVAEAPELHGLVAALAERAGLERVPALYLVRSPAPNAAAVGSRDRSAILLTPSLAQGLSERELAAVLAHEVSHVRHGDLRLFAFTGALRRMSWVSSQVGWFLLFVALPATLWGAPGVPLGTTLLLVTAPLGAQLLELAILRAREFAADLGAVELTGDPRALASALGRIERSSRSLLRALLPVPIPEEPVMVRTHPATSERVRRLEELAYAAG